MEKQWWLVVRVHCNWEDIRSSMATRGHFLAFSLIPSWRCQNKIFSWDFSFFRAVLMTNIIKLLLWFPRRLKAVLTSFSVEARFWEDLLHKDTVDRALGVVCYIISWLVTQSSLELFHSWIRHILTEESNLGNTNIWEKLGRRRGVNNDWAESS